MRTRTCRFESRVFAHQQYVYLSCERAAKLNKYPCYMIAGSLFVHAIPPARRSGPGPCVYIPANRKETKTVTTPSSAVVHDPTSQYVKIGGCTWCKSAPYLRDGYPHGKHVIAPGESDQPASSCWRRSPRDVLGLPSGSPRNFRRRSVCGMLGSVFRNGWWRIFRRMQEIRTQGTTSSSRRLLRAETELPRRWDCPAPPRQTQVAVMAATLSDNHATAQQ